MMKPKDDVPKPRSVENVIEVDARPEQVWQAIATGPGIACWFVPAEVVAREGGTISLDMGSGMAPSGVVRVWDPLRRFVYEEDWQALDDAPAGKLASEFIIEARSGGTCVVRLVSNLFASGGEWDGELDNLHKGWKTYFENLRLYLKHFPGERCSSIVVAGNAQGSKAEAYQALVTALGLSSVERQQTSTRGPGVPRLAGVVELVGEGEHHGELLLRLDEPARGTALIFVYAYRGRAFTNLRAYLFGDEANAVAERELPRWQTWMREHFPVARDSS